jgi:hypothetical protein
MRQLDRTGSEFARADCPLLTACGELLAIADSARGLAVSADGGTTFVRISGCTNATALAAWKAEERLHVAAALYRDADQVSDIALIDVANGSAECIGVVREDEHARASDDGDGVERARVERMAWDAASGRLYVAGSFGLMSFQATEKAA